MNRLQGKTAIVTGAAGGIGGAVMKLFLEEGAKVVGLGRNAESLAEAVASMGHSDRALTLGCDISDEDQVRQTVTDAVEWLGGLTTLCNAAGGSSNSDGRVHEVSTDEFWRVIGVDLFGTFVTAKYGIPAMISGGGGSIINFTSVAALMALKGRDCYTSAKGGVASLTRSMAIGYGPDSIRVNAVAPGTTLSPRVAKRAASEQAKKLAERHVLGVMEPDHVAPTALFLASEDSSHLTGQTITVDSGLTIS